MKTPADGDGCPARTARAVARHFLNSIFKDHAFIRMIYMNAFDVSPNMRRSGQPTPAQIRDAARQGIRTIVNLRGRRENCGSWVLEEEACRRHGVRLVDFPVNSRDVPKKETLHKAREMFASIEYPALMHCKAGADRVGFMSALYLLVHERRPLEDAVRQLDWRYGHFRQAKTGILDYFFDAYRDHIRQDPVDFYTWVDQVYDPPALKTRFMSQWWANVLNEKVLRRE
ncbi:MAG TPA: sulfur transferase domain-containing protein [Azospirillaceae bacterium]|nr:sulfur transferase domain-containing protein [Azospirillaceae bacterium]